MSCCYLLLTSSLYIISRPITSLLFLLGVIEPANDTAASALEAIVALETSGDAGWGGGLVASSGSQSEIKLARARSPRSSGGKKGGHRFSSAESLVALKVSLLEGI